MIEAVASARQGPVRQEGCVGVLSEKIALSKPKYRNYPFGFFRVQGDNVSGGVESVKRYMNAKVGKTRY
jgi:hypothetical protein